jgi:hypothetical protein
VRRYSKPNAPSGPIAAIETAYNGVVFRSRTEARYAVYFDVLGVRWLYEPEAYSLDSGPYLPDFLLPDLDLFVEIKGKHASDLEEQKCADLAISTGKNVVLFPHEPRVSDQNRSASGGVMFFSSGGQDEGYWFCCCPICMKIDVQFDGRGGRVRCGCRHDSDKEYTGDHPIFADAVRSANGFRFWSAK